MWKLTLVKPSSAPEKSQSSPQSAAAKALLTPGMPPQEAELVSASAIGSLRSRAASIQVLASSLKRVIRPGASNCATVTLPPLQVVAGYSCTVTSLRLEGPTPSMKVPKSRALRQRQQVAGPMTGYFLAVGFCWKEWK